MSREVISVAIVKTQISSFFIVINVLIIVLGAVDL